MFGRLLTRRPTLFEEPMFVHNNYNNDHSDSTPFSAVELPVPCSFLHTFLSFTRYPPALGFSGSALPLDIGENASRSPAPIWLALRSLLTGQPASLLGEKYSLMLYSHASIDTWLRRTTAVEGIESRPGLRCLLCLKQGIVNFNCLWNEELMY